MSATVHYYRIYDSLGCFTPNNGALTLDMPLDPGISVRIYLGSEPEHRHVAHRFDNRKFMIPAQPDVYDSWPPHPSSVLIQEGAPLPDPLPVFTEVHCWKEFELSDEVATGLLKDDEHAKQAAMLEASEHQTILTTAADLAAGIVALRIHKQFVLQFAADAYFVQLGNKASGVTHSKHVEALDPILLDRATVTRIVSDWQIPVFGKADTWQKNAQLLRWLLKAWDEQDNINRFVSLFLPLELLLEAQRPDDQEPDKLKSSLSDRELKGLLKQMIHKHGGEHKRELRDYLNLLEPKRPSLLSRFRAYASRTGIPNWEKDVEAFERFNRMRNDLFHGRGLRAFEYETLAPGTKTQSTDAPNEELTKMRQALRKLTDLTERYVSYAIFGDTYIYLSRDRRKGRI